MHGPGGSPVAEGKALLWVSPDGTVANAQPREGWLHDGGIRLSLPPDPGRVWVEVTEARTGSRSYGAALLGPLTGGTVILKAASRIFDLTQQEVTVRAGDEGVQLFVAD